MCEDRLQLQRTCFVSGTMPSTYLKTSQQPYEVDILNLILQQTVRNVQSLAQCHKAVKQQPWDVITSQHNFKSPAYDVDPRLSEWSDKY